jgi:beta-lactamase regulating signal transducer with metallopeptidase domain
MITVARLLVPIEFSFTREINIDVILPSIQVFLQSDILFGFLPISRFALLVAMSVLISVFLLCSFIKSVLVVIQDLQKLQSTDNDRLIMLMEEVIDQTNVRAPYVIVTIPEVRSPTICRLRKPVITMPEKCLELSDKDIRAIFRHEWQHYINKDLWIKMIAIVLGYIMWWNPFISRLQRSLQKTLELKCDLDVTRNMSDEDTLEYAESLFNACNKLYEGLLEEEKTSVQLSLPFTGASAKNAKSEDDLTRRFRMMLPFEKRNHKISIVCCVFIASLFLLSYGFVIQPYIHVPKDELWCQVSKDDYVVHKGFTTNDVHILSHENGTYSLYIQSNFATYVEDLETFIQMFGNVPVISLYDILNDK